MDRRINIISFGAFAVSTVAFLFAGLLPLIAADTGIAISQAGYLVTAYSMSYAIFTPIISAIIGGYDRRHVIAAALVMFVAGTVLTATSSSMVQLVLAQIITGMAAGQFSATGQAVAIALAPAQFRARAISLVVGGTTFAVALGAPLGSFLAHYTGWRSGFIAIGCVATLCLVVLWLTLPKHLPGASLPLRQRLAVIGHPGVARLILTSFIYMSGGFLIVAYLGPIVIDGVGLSPELLPVVLLIYGVGAICGNMLSGRITDRVGGRRMVLVSIITTIFGSLAVYLITAHLPADIAGYALMGMLFVWGVSSWAYAPAQTSRLVSAAPEVTHLSLSLQVSSIYLGIALGTFVGGRVLEYAGIPALGLASAAFAVCALVIVLLEKPQAEDALAAHA